MKYFEVYLNWMMKTYVCRYVRVSGLCRGVKTGGFRGAGVARRPHSHRHVCAHCWCSGERPTRVKNVASGDGVDALLFDVVYVAYVFLYTKKYPILLFFFGKRVRVGDTKKQKLATYWKPRIWEEFSPRDVSINHRVGTSWWSSG